MELLIGLLFFHLFLSKSIICPLERRKKFVLFLCRRGAGSLPRLYDWSDLCSVTDASFLQENII